MTERKTHKPSWARKGFGSAFRTKDTNMREFQPGASENTTDTGFKPVAHQLQPNQLDNPDHRAVNIPSAHSVKVIHQLLVGGSFKSDLHQEDLSLSPIPPALVGGKLRA